MSQEAHIAALRSALKSVEWQFTDGDDDQCSLRCSACFAVRDPRDGWPRHNPGCPVAEALRASRKAER